MSREKAIEYLEAAGFKGTAIESLIRNFSIIMPTIPASVWTEFAMGLDYSIPMNAIADRMAAALTDEEIDEMVAMARSPAFQKHVKLYPSFMDTMREQVPIWLRDLRDHGDLERLGRLIRKSGIDEELADMVVASFTCAIEYDFNVPNPGTGN